MQSVSLVLILLLIGHQSTCSVSADCLPRFAVTERNKTLEYLVGKRISLLCEAAISSECSAHNKDVQLTIKWTFNNGPLPTGFYFPNQSENVLKSDSLKVSDRGNFTCVVSNRFGDDLKHFFLNVIQGHSQPKRLPYSPYIGNEIILHRVTSREIQDVSSLIGQRLTLQCGIFVSRTVMKRRRSKPAFNLTWWREQVVLKNDSVAWNVSLYEERCEKVILDNTTLIFLPNGTCFKSELQFTFREGLLGKYECRVGLQNRQSEASIQYHLIQATIQREPQHRVTEQPQRLIGKTAMSHDSESMPLRLSFTSSPSNICAGHNFTLVCSTMKMDATLFIHKCLHPPCIHYNVSWYDTLQKASMTTSHEEKYEDIQHQKPPFIQKSQPLVRVTHRIIHARMEDNGTYFCEGHADIEGQPVLAEATVYVIDCVSIEWKFLIWLLPLVGLTFIVLLGLVCIFRVRYAYSHFPVMKTVYITVTKPAPSFNRSIPPWSHNTSSVQPVVPPDVNITTHAISGKEMSRKCKRERYTSVSLNEGRSLYQLPLDTRWEVDRHRIQLQKRLGEGAFGVVYLAKLTLEDKQETVAVKMLKDGFTEEDLVQFVKEMEVMKALASGTPHPNVIRLLATCTRNGALQVLVEYAPYDNLKNFLRNHRAYVELTSALQPVNPSSSSSSSSSSSLSISQLVEFGRQVASGMHFLGSRSLVHRDLAARNILVGENLVMKIADFGLSRTVCEYYRKLTVGRLPLKWMAPESLNKNVYTIQSDVWSFGILLWEVFTLGDTPYASVPVERLAHLICKGQRNEPPSRAPLSVVHLMNLCWELSPSARPTFAHLMTALEQIRDTLEVEQGQTPIVLDEGVSAYVAPGISALSDNGDSGVTTVTNFSTSCDNTSVGSSGVACGSSEGRESPLVASEVAEREDGYVAVTSDSPNEAYEMNTPSAYVIGY